MKLFSTIYETRGDGINTLQCLTEVRVMIEQMITIMKDRIKALGYLPSVKYAE